MPEPFRLFLEAALEFSCPTIITLNGALDVVIDICLV